MLGVHTAGSWLVLGGFSADLKSSRGCRKDSLREAKRLPEGGRKAPRMPKMRRKGCQKGSKGTPKPQKNESVFRNRFRMPPRVPTRTLCPSFWLHFGSSLGAKIVNCSSHFLPSFSDAFLEAFGCIFCVIVMVFGCLFWFFSRLCEKWRTPRKCCK